MVVAGQEETMADRLMVGEHRLQDNVVRVTRGQHGAAPAVCQLCDSFQQETVEHLLFQCSAHEELRSTWWREVEAVAPPVLLGELSRMGARERTVFILSGLRSGFIPEWEETYTALLNYAINLYLHRTAIT